MDTKEKKPAVWEVFEGCADVRDKPEDALTSFDLLKKETGTSPDDIPYGNDRPEMGPAECGCAFKRPGAAGPAPYFYGNGHAGQELPFTPV